MIWNYIVIYSLFAILIITLLLRTAYKRKQTAIEFVDWLAKANFKRYPKGKTDLWYSQELGYFNQSSEDLYYLFQEFTK